jgi:peptidoglycan hydrolase-like protein with peptidoglycan-binding domain
MGYLPHKRTNGAVIARGAMTPSVAPSGDIASGERGTTLTREQIRAFQTKLIDLGFTNEGRVIADGAFGDNTRAAVRAFQSARSLTQSGTLDASTRAALDASPGLTLLVPRSGPQSQSEIARVPGIVAFYQQVLGILGANANGRLRVDGALGPNTSTAVTEFQRWWSPENLRRANSSPNDDDQARWRAALARTENGRIEVDGNLGPDTQRLLLWLAIPRAEGGGGEAEEYGTLAPANSVRPYTLEITRQDGRATGYRLRSPDAAPTPAESGGGQSNSSNPPRSTRAADLLREITSAQPQSVMSLGSFDQVVQRGQSTRRIPGRRTVSITGLNPQVGARIFADGVDVTSMAEENGTAARWVGNVWRMGIPDTTQVIRVVANDRAESQVNLPAPTPPVASFGDDSAPSVANNIAQRTVVVTVPLTGSPSVQGQAAPPPAATTDPNAALAASRIPGRRTVFINGLNPQSATRVFADGVDVTLTPEESGQAARWEGGAWRMGVPDTASVLRVTAANGLDFSVNLPPAAPVTADAVNNIVQRSVRVDAPAAPVAPTQAGMGNIVWFGAAAAILAGVYFSTQGGSSNSSKR